MGGPTKLILDVDTGTDDAIALMLAVLHPDLELVAATTVNGNNPVAACTDNTLRVFDLLGVDVPVYEGAASPLLRGRHPSTTRCAWPTSSIRRWSAAGRRMSTSRLGAN